MGVAVIGGLLVGTLLTLFVVPAMMSFLTSKVGRVQRFAEDNQESAAI
jgi:multidrug efflux pump